MLRTRLSRRDLTLPAAGLFTALAEGGARAAVPPALGTATAATAMGRAAGGVPGAVSDLVEGVVRQMFLTKVKAAAGSK